MNNIYKNKWPNTNYS